MALVAISLVKGHHCYITTLKEEKAMERLVRDYIASFQSHCSDSGFKQQQMRWFQ